MSIVNLNFNIKDQKALGDFLRACLAIPNWLKVVLLASFLAAAFYFCGFQKLFYGPQVKEIETLKQEVIKTKNKMNYQVISTEKYTSDYRNILYEFYLIRQENEKLIEMHDNDIEIIVNYLRAASRNSRDLYYLERDLKEESEYFKKIKCIYHESSKLFKKDGSYFEKDSVVN